MNFYQFIGVCSVLVLYTVYCTLSIYLKPSNRNLLNV